MSIDRGDSLVEDFAVEFSEGSLQCVDLAIAIVGRAVSFVAYFPSGLTSRAGFLAGLVTNLPADVRTAGFTGLVASRWRFHATRPVALLGAAALLGTVALLWATALLGTAA